MVMKNPCGVEGPVVSVTVTMKVYVPLTVGVPEIVPAAALRVSPGGKEPPVNAHMQGQVCGAATNDAVYGVPTWPLGKEPGKMTGAACAGLTNREKALKIVSRQSAVKRRPRPTPRLSKIRFFMNRFLIPCIYYSSQAVICRYQIVNL